MPGISDPTTSAPTLVDPATLYLSAALLLLMLASGGFAAFVVVVLQRWTNQRAAHRFTAIDPDTHTHIVNPNAVAAVTRRAIIADADTEPWPVVRDEFGTRASPSVTARTLQALSGFDWCPVCVVLRCTQLGVRVADVLPLYVGQQVYCPRHTRMMALAKYDASDPAQRKWVERHHDTQHDTHEESGQGQTNGEN